MKNPKFDFIFLGQSVLKYQVPLDIFNSINHIYETNFNNLYKEVKKNLFLFINETKYHP